MVRWVPIAVSAFVVMGSACIVEAPSGEPGTSPAMSRARQPIAPQLNVQTGANLGDKVELVGATIVPGAARPGEAVKVTMHLKVLAPFDVDYMVFVHVEDAEGRGERFNVDHPPLNGMHPTSRWKAGETLRDEFSVFVPSTSSARALRLFVGFWDPRTDTRLPLRNADRVRNDGNNRILLAHVPVVG